MRAYRTGWSLLALVAVVSLAWSWFDPSAATAIWLLRLSKAAILIGVSAILYRRRSADPVAAMLAIAFLLWTISSSVDFVDNSAISGIVDRFRFLFFALALTLFPNGEWQPRWTRHLASAIFATFLLGIAEACGLVTTSIYLPIAIGCVLAALAAMTARYRALDAGVEKQQLKWVMLGLVCGIGMILAARAAAQLTQGMAGQLVSAILLEGLFQLGIVIVALGFLTSLLRYRLYDAEAAISRSAVYAALTLTLVGTFAASESLIELVGQRFFGMAIGNISGAVAAAVAAMMLTPLHGRISMWAEQHFQHDLVTLKQELPDMLAILSAGASVKQFSSVALPRIEQAVQATRIALLVDGRLVGAQGLSLGSARGLLKGWQPPELTGAFDRSDDDAFPLRIALRCPLGSIRAWLLLGPRPDGSFYGKDDLEALEEIVPPLQRSLMLVVEHEREAHRRRRSDEAIRKAIQCLTERVAALERFAPTRSAQR